MNEIINFVDVSIKSDKIAKIMEAHKTELDLFFSFDNDIIGGYEIKDDMFSASASNPGRSLGYIPSSKEGIVRSLISLFSFGKMLNLDILHDDDIENDYNEYMVPLLEALLVNQDALTESITKAEWTLGDEKFGNFGNDKTQWSFTYEVKNNCDVEEK